MRIAFLTESRADWGGIKPVMLEAFDGKNQVELWITVEHLARGTVIDIVKEVDSIKIGSQIVRKFFPRGMDIEHEQVKIDWLVVLGDREQVLYFVIDAWKAGIKIAHISGGDKQEGRVVDEPVRNCISQFATLHFPSLAKSADRLIDMGFDYDTVRFVGSPYVTELVDFKPIRNDYNGYYLVQMHPEPNCKAYAAQILDSLKGKKVKLMRPNWDYKSFLLDFDYFATGYDIEVIENLPRKEFLNLLWNSKCFIGNSSALFLEAQYLGVPCLLVGERNLGREEAFPGHIEKWPCDCEALEWQMIRAIAKDARQLDGLRSNWKHGAHGDGTAPQKILAILEGK